jgi:hypothetical protein
MWYWVKGNGNIMTASTCHAIDPSFDTQLALYSGECGDLNCLEWNDDFCGKQSTISWISVPGENYYILVMGTHMTTGLFELYVDESTGGDSCEYSIPSLSDNAGNNVEMEGSTEGSSYYDLGVGYCGLQPRSRTIWYSIIGNGKEMAVSTCAGPANFTAVFAVFTGSCDALECVEGASSKCGSTRGQQYLSWNTTMGQEYFVAVYGDIPDSTGSFTLKLLRPQEMDVVENDDPEPDSNGVPIWMYIVVPCSVIFFMVIVLKWRNLSQTGHY